MTALIGFLREFMLEVARRSTKYSGDSDPNSLATAAAIIEIGEAIEAAMKKTLLA